MTKKAANWRCSSTDCSQQCDEAEPQCGLCVKRRLRCSFQPMVTPSPSEMQSSPRRNSEHVGSREVELMHFYATTTYKSLSRGEIDDHIWQLITPQEAFKHHWLLNGIFALTCLHQATLEHDDVKPWIEWAIQYQSNALHEFSHVLPNIVSENCEAAFLFSTLTTITCLAQMGNGFSDPLTIVKEVRQYNKGSGIILMSDSEGHFLFKGRLSGLHNDPDGYSLAIFWDGSCTADHVLEK